MITSHVEREDHSSIWFKDRDGVEGVVTVNVDGTLIFTVDEGKLLLLDEGDVRNLLSVMRVVFGHET